MKKAYLIRLPNLDYAVIREGAQDQLLGTFRKKEDAEVFLAQKNKSFAKEAA